MSAVLVPLDPDHAPPDADQERAREYSRDLWLNDKWDKAIHPLSWLIEKFAPVPDWSAA